MTIDRFLCFQLGSEEFGIPLLGVKEVLGVPDITPVPFAPNHLIGIMNLRGQVISLIDLRSKFGIKSRPLNECSVVICDLEVTSVGIVVDSIESVIAPVPENLAPKPEIEGRNTSEYITAIYRKDGRMVLLLDVAKALSLIDKTLSLSSSKQRRAS